MKKKTTNIYLCMYVYHHYHSRNTLFKIHNCGSGIDWSTTTTTVTTKSISVKMYVLSWLYKHRNNYTTLHFLVRTNAGGDEDYHRHADLIFLEELIRLYRMDLFKQEDIRYKLVTESIRDDSQYLEERRFRFLVQMNPYSLIHTHDGINEYYN